MKICKECKYEYNTATREVKKGQWPPIYKCPSCGEDEVIIYRPLLSIKPIKRKA